MPDAPVSLHTNTELLRTDLELLGHVFFPGTDLAVTAGPGPVPSGCRVSAALLPAGAPGPDGRPERWEVAVTAGPVAQAATVAPAPGLGPRAYEHVLRRAAKGALVDALAAHTGYRPPWGHLTGVRPTRLAHDLLDPGLAPGQVRALLQDEYRLDPAKAALLVDIAALQRPCLHRDPRRVSLYVGIPYCPTICNFCSFSIYPLVEHREQVPDFLAALHRELAVVGEAIHDLGLSVEAVYLGGGTPTSPPDAAFAALLDQIAATVLRGQVPREYSVEAGRPETISRAKLDAMAHHGVTRLSVNPQTTVQATLKHLGRIHTVSAFYMAYERVRAHPHPFVVNSDIIIGLPGEGPEEVAQTLAGMRRLAPDNLTVHTLAVKRGSRLHVEGAGPGILRRLDPAAAEELVAAAAATAAAMGQRPYYLYRQKYMVGALENVGYSLPGRESLYNIQMLNSRSTVLGLGHAATTHYWRPPGWYLAGPENPRDPATYMARVHALARAKARDLHLLLGEHTTAAAAAGLLPPE